MQAAKYWRTRKMRYRLSQAMQRRKAAVQLPRVAQLELAAPVRLPKAKLSRAS